MTDPTAAIAIRFFVDLCLCGRSLRLPVVFEGNPVLNGCQRWVGAQDGAALVQTRVGDCGLEAHRAHLSCRYFNRQNYLCAREWA
jgi:hypothetical protein